MQQDNVKLQGNVYIDDITRAHIVNTACGNYNTLLFVPKIKHLLMSKTNLSIAKLCYVKIQTL